MVKHFFKYIPYIMLAFIISNMFADYEFLYLRKGYIIPGTYSETFFDKKGEHQSGTTTFVGCNFSYRDKNGNIINVNDNRDGLWTWCGTRTCPSHPYFKDDGSVSVKGEYTFYADSKSVILKKLRNDHIVVYKPFYFTNIFFIVLLLIYIFILVIIRNESRPKNFYYVCPVSMFCNTVTCKRSCCVAYAEASEAYNMHAYVEFFKLKCLFLGYKKSYINKFLKIYLAGKPHNYNYVLCRRTPIVGKYYNYYNDIILDNHDFKNMKKQLTLCKFIKWYKNEK